MAQHPGPASRIHDCFHIIVDAVRQGLPIKAACALADVTPSTFHRWMRYGEQESTFLDANSETVNGPDYVSPKTYEDGTLRSSVYKDFMSMVLKARAECALEHVANVTNAAQDPRFWAASAWWLERQMPQEFAQTQRHELTGKDGGPIETVDSSRQEQMATRVLEQAALTKRRALPPPAQERQ